MMMWIGKFGGMFLAALFCVKMVILLAQYFLFQSLTIDEVLLRIILFAIPTEATIVETLASYPIAMLVVLFLYLKFVKAQGY